MKFTSTAPKLYIRIKVEKILKDCLNSIPSPSPSVKIQSMGGKVCLRCKGKTLLGVDNKLLQCWTVGTIFTFGRSQMFGHDKLWPLAIGEAIG